MATFFDLPFDLPEDVYTEDFVIATYLAYGLDWSDAYTRAGGFAVGQTVGTWIPIPGVTRAMIESYQARCVGCYPIPGEESTTFLLRIAFPMHNFGGSFAMMLTALVGNDVSTSLQIKLIDLEFVGRSLEHYKGPAKGIDGIREITGIKDRPLILNMLKPCIGYTPEEGAKLFYLAGKGGIDLIKDDEIHGGTDISSVAGRLRAYNAAAKRIYEEQGHLPLYIVNVTDKPAKMRENVKVAIEEGAQAVMVNYINTGLDALSELTAEFGEKLFFLAHYAGVGVFDHIDHGIASSVFLGKLARMAGADASVVMYPGEKQDAGYFEYIKTVQAHRSKMGKMKMVMSTVGGGVTPRTVVSIYQDLGKDSIIAIGGTIQGHPMGTVAGGKAIMTALDAAVKGISLEEASGNSPELKCALETWK